MEWKRLALSGEETLSEQNPPGFTEVKRQRA